MEILIVGIIVILLFNYIGAFSFNKFVDDNKVAFEKLKEDDYDFLVISKYGDKVNPNERFQKRVKKAVVALLILFLVAITSVRDLNMAIKLVIVFVITYLIYKDDYNKVKRFYKAH